jgi:hypothetical protein
MGAATALVLCIGGGIIGVVTGIIETTVLGAMMENLGAETLEYQEWLKSNPEPTLESVKKELKAKYPDTAYSNSDYTALHDRADKEWEKQSSRLKFDLGLSTPRGRDIFYKASMGTGVGMVVIGTGALAGFLGLPIAAGIITPAVKGTRAVCKKMNQVMILREIRSILNMVRAVPVYRNIYDEIEAELNTTLTENPLAVTHGETRASMANFTGAPSKGVLKGVTSRSMANFTGAKAGGKKRTVRKVRRTNHTKRRKN